MIKFLRYATRHHFYYEKGNGIKLNPISSCSHNDDGARTISKHEPRWVYLLRRKWFGYAGETLCEGGAKAIWQYGADGNRTCSHCGSIHFLDLVEIAEKSISNPAYSVSHCDKRYKFYVKQPGVRNAGEGAIKFYIWHFIPDVTDEQSKVFDDAVMLSAKRFEEMVAKHYGKPNA